MIDPPAPLHLHDISDLLHTRIHENYTSLQQTFISQSFQQIHAARPRPLQRPDWVQHLFQACLLFMRNPNLSEHLRTTHSTTPQTPQQISHAAFFLLVLLHSTQPLPAIPIRLDTSSVNLLNKIAVQISEGPLLLNYLISQRAFLIVAQLRHGPSPAPTLLSSSTTSLQRRWAPHAMYGYEVSIPKARALLSGAEQVVETNEVCESADQILQQCRAVSETAGERLQLPDALVDTVAQYVAVRKTAVDYINGLEDAPIPVLDLFEDAFFGEVAEIGTQAKMSR